MILLCESPAPRVCLRVILCVRIRGRLTQREGMRAGAITWGVAENMGAAKYNNHGSPGITG